MRRSPRRGAPSRTRLAWGLGGVGVLAAACGQLLGIEDIPPVKGLPDAQKAVPDGGADATPAAKDAGTDAAKDAPLVGQLPKPSGPHTASTTEMNFAVHRLWFGDTAKTDAFVASSSAWSTFGYNIDGKVTTAASTDVCTLAPGAFPTMQVDGDMGADNSFGENVVALLSVVFTGGVSKDVTNRIEQKGDFTLLLDTVGLTNTPTQTNQGLSIELLGGASLGAPPTFALSENWPVAPSSLADGRTLAGGGKVTSDDAYVTGGTFVSGSPTDFVLGLPIANSVIALVLHQTVLTFEHVIDDAGQSHAVNGMLAGIISPVELTASLEGASSSIVAGTDCSALSLFEDRFVESQDIMLDGTNVEGFACDGVSIGIAFSADEIAPPSVVGSQPNPVDAGPGCPHDGGPG